MYSRSPAIDEERNAYSIIGSRFGVSFEGVTSVAGRSAVNARITGRGWIHGIHQIGLDPDDPFRDGYLLSDCWGDACDLLD